MAKHARPRRPCRIPRPRRIDVLTILCVAATPIIVWVLIIAADSCASLDGPAECTYIQQGVTP